MLARAVDETINVPTLAVSKMPRMLSSSRGIPSSLNGTPIVKDRAPHDDTQPMDNRKAAPAKNAALHKDLAHNSRRSTTVLRHLHALRVDHAAFGAQGGLVNALVHRRVGVHSGNDVLRGRLQTHRQGHFRNQFARVLADDVRAEDFAVRL